MKKGIFSKTHYELVFLKIVVYSHQSTSMKAREVMKMVSHNK